MKAPTAWEKAVLPAGYLHGIFQEHGMYMKKISSKHSAPCFPLGVFFKAVGGIPVDRSRKTSLVDQMVHKFAEYKKFNLAITPEGTRKANPNWKKGFYFIALKAQVPIVLIGIDYSKKTISATKAIMPSGDINKDMREIKLYFKDFKGKHPENFALGEI